MWKDFIGIEGLGRGDVERLCCHKGPLGSGRREELSALTPTSNHLCVSYGPSPAASISEQVIRVKKTCGAATPSTRITWVSFLGS